MKLDTAILKLPAPLLTANAQAEDSQPWEVTGAARLSTSSGNSLDHHRFRRDHR